MNASFSSLYIHVPFCVKKCHYCAFYSIPWKEEFEKLYLQSILKEIDIIKEIPNKLETIYIGGGTPTVLSLKTLKVLLEKILKCFKISNNLEFSIELNPVTVDNEKLILIKDFGINRVSVGVQSFNDDELRSLGRLHDRQQALQTVKKLLDSGFENISIDLIYGIPLQTINTWVKTLNESLNLEIRHISIYELTVEEETELKKEIESGKIRLPDEHTIADMYLLATEFFENKGIKKYEISNFAYPNFECKHNIGYWVRKPYLGVGPSAHSFIGNRRFHNPDLFEYSRILSENKLAWIEDMLLDDFEDLKEKIILGLRMKNGTVVENVYLLEFFKQYEREGLIKISDKRVCLTDKGMLLSNEIFSKLLFYLETKSNFF